MGASSAEMGVEKPDERIFTRAFEMAACHAENAVRIGDKR